MNTIQLAANYIDFTGSIGLNWGHLQIVRGDDEIEVQTPFTIEGQLGLNGTSFVFPPTQAHLVNTDNADASGENDFYKRVDLSVGDRDPDRVWELLSSLI